MSGNLSRVQITQRNRARHKILRSALKENGITERRLYVDDRLYSDLVEMAEEYGESSIHIMLFRAMRDYLTAHTGKSYEGQYFTLENAMISAHAHMEAEGLGALRAVASSVNSSGENF